MNECTKENLLDNKLEYNYHTFGHELTKIIKCLQYQCGFCEKQIIIKIDIYIYINHRCIC